VRIVPEHSFKYWAKSALTDAQFDAALHHRLTAAQAPR